MSYFSSLAQHKATQEAVAQHTQDAEDAIKDAKAQASQKAFEGYSQLLESAGGSTTGLAGGFHLTRKIYKKYQAGKKAIQDLKDRKSARETGGDEEGNELETDTPDRSGESGTGDDPAPSTETDAPDVPDAPSQAPNPQVEQTEPPADDAPDDAPDDIGAPNDLGESGSTEAPTASATEPQPPNPQAEQFEPPADDELQDTPLNEQNKPENPETEGGGEAGTEAPDTQYSSFSNEGQGADSGAVRPTNTAPEPTEAPRAPEPEPPGEPEPAGAPEPAGGGAPEPAGGGAGVEAEVDAEASDRISQGAQAFSKITPTPKGGLGNLGVDASADAGDLATAGADIGSTTLDALSVGLDFLGPVGEIAGAGIALGGFFHSLFDSGEKSKEEKDEDAQVDMSQGGGISAQSLQSAGQTSNQVGSTF